MNVIRTRTVFVGLPSLLLLVAVGCGGDAKGPGRYSVEGAITFNGQAVPLGTVTFEPAKGTVGPASIAPISNGRYRTPRDKGVVGGPHVAVVRGYEAPTGQANEEGIVERFGKPLFQEVRIDVELPEKDTEHDLTLPRSK